MTLVITISWHWPDMYTGSDAIQEESTPIGTNPFSENTEFDVEMIYIIARRKSLQLFSES